MKKSRLFPRQHWRPQDWSQKITGRSYPTRPYLWLDVFSFQKQALS